MIVLSKISNVPQIRFKGFTDAWEQRKLGEITEKFEYGLNAAATDFDGVNQYLRITDIDDESREFNKTSLTSPDTNLALANNYLLKQGDILFARTGASVGKTYQYKESDGRVYYAGFLIRARILSGFNPGFVFQNTLTKRYENFVSITSQRSGQPGINAQEYAGFKLLLPKFEEQEQISDLFIRLDNLITLHQRKYDQVVNFKRAMLEKMFPKNGSRIPEIRFKGYTGEWEQRKLGEICEITTGRLDANAMVPDGAYDFYTSGIAKYKIDVPAFSGPAITIAGNGATVGFMHLADGLFNAYQRTYVLSNFAADRHYLFYEIGNRLPVKIAQEARTGNIPYIVMDMLTDLKLYIPSSDEQKSIGMYFEKIDNLITLHQRKLQQLKNIKKALLEKMFV